MVPRADVEAIELSTTLGELLSVFEQSGHSRMPVYVETLDDPRGMVHIRDVLAHITQVARVRQGRATKKAPAVSVLDLAKVDLARTIDDLSLIRPVLFVPPSMLASDLMARMQAARIQMALVIDEYGGTDGLVSLEDAIETIVGDIAGEHDEAEPELIAEGDGVYVADGGADLEDVSKAVGALAPPELAEELETVGGLVFTLLGRIPAAGETLTAPGGQSIVILDADQRRVKRLRISPPRRETTGAATDIGAEPGLAPRAASGA
jgi:CBS domain containing-hemolysin-like protein